MAAQYNMSLRHGQLTVHEAMPAVSLSSKLTQHPIIKPITRTLETTFSAGNSQQRVTNIVTRVLPNGHALAVVDTSPCG